MYFAILMTLLLFPAASAGARQNHPSGAFDASVPIHVVPVQGKVYMLVVGGADGVNITAQVGDQGIFLVDSGPPALSEKLIETLHQHFGTKPVRYLINTHSHVDHTGGNLALTKTFGIEDTGSFYSFTGIRSVAHLNTLNRMNGFTSNADELPPEALPISSFFGEKKELYFNGEGIVLYFEPDAHTDGDIIVWFRGSDVISAGDTFVMGNYPVIDSERGGSLQGLINAGIRLVDLAIPEINTVGGTRIIPGHGRLTNESEAADYFFMLTIIRDRVQDLIGQGMTLAQVKAARPTLDFDTVYGGKNSFWIPDMFLEAVYRELRSQGR
jgi:glyoxylase-like metal-dependent hydrolase (beta-lactamase superfamily II)